MNGRHSELVSTCLRAVAPLLWIFTGHVLLADDTSLKRPVTVAASRDGKLLYTANRNGRSISIVDATIPKVIGEIDCRGRLADLALVNDDFLLALDEEHSLLLSLKRIEENWQLVSNVAVPRYTCRLAVDPHGGHCYVASLWGQTLTKFSVSTPESSAKRISELRLDFEPQHLCFTQDSNHLVIASAFDARLAIVKLADFTVISSHTLRGHNIGGLAISKDGKLLWTMQELSALAHSTKDDIHWGNMISNVLVEVPLAELLDEQRFRDDKLLKWQLGEPGDAAGDPGQVVVANDTLAIAFSGVGQIAICQIQSNRLALERIKTGQRPVSLAVFQDQIAVANMYSDSLSIVPMAGKKPVAHVQLGSGANDLSAIQKGEILFFDCGLSLDGWMSCHSCHTVGHTNQQLNDNMSDGSFGAAKRVPSLLGVADTAPWAWNGSMRTLEEQVSKSVQHTMQGKLLSDEQVGCFVSYLKTLSLPTRKADQSTSANAQVQNGAKLFEEFECAKCHAPPVYTTPRTYDVKLTDSAGNQQFNPPSLRGLEHRNRLFHDSRASSLAEVFQSYEHGITRQLNDSELMELVAFLRSL